MKKLIAGPTVYICDECIGLCNDIIAEEVEKDEPYTGSTPIPKPAEIKAILDEYVVGQEQAKKVIVRNGAFTPAAILAAVAHAHNLGVADIVSRARFKHISHARQHACALMRELTGLSFNDIAQAVGISDHGTAHHACKIWAERNRVYADEDRAARQMLGANQ